MKKGGTIISGLAMLILAGALQAEAAPVRAAHAETELVADVKTVAAGEVFRVGVRVRLDPGWHTYWINPGEAGAATVVKWHLPEGFEAGPLQWPYPRRFVSDGVVGFGYENEAIFFAEITPPSELQPGTEVQIEAEIEVLLCKEICVPGFARLQMRFEAGAERVEDAEGSAVLVSAAAEVPRSVHESAVSARFEAGMIILRVESIKAAPPLFFAEARNLIAVERDPVWIERDGALEGQFQLSHLARGTPFRLRGVLVWQDEQPMDAWQVDVRLRR